MGILTKIRIWLDKWRSGSALLEAADGRFRVHYFEGQETIPMYWKNAKSYAQIFGGYIYHIPTGKKVTAYYSINELTG